MKNRGETHVVNRHHGASFDVDIARGSEWGNPYRIGPDGSRAQVVAKYEMRIRDLLVCDNGKIDQTFRTKLRRLHGMTLGCFCSPKRCHGDVLKYYAAWAARKAPCLPTPRFQAVLENQMQGLWSRVKTTRKT